MSDGQGFPLQCKWETWFESHFIGLSVQHPTHRQTKFKAKGSEDDDGQNPLQTCISLVGCGVICLSVWYAFVSTKKNMNQQKQQINGNVASARICSIHHIANISFKTI